MNKELETLRVENSPAFPCPVGHIECNHPTGMTLRDYFAAKAMQGIVSNVYFPTAKQYGAEQLAQDAYQIADAMLGEREKGESK